MHPDIVRLMLLLKKSRDWSLRQFRRATANGRTPDRFLNKDILPVVYTQVPGRIRRPGLLAHLCLPLIGEGRIGLSGSVCLLRKYCGR